MRRPIDIQFFLPGSLPGAPETINTADTTVYVELPDTLTIAELKQLAVNKIQNFGPRYNGSSLRSIQIYFKIDEVKL